MTDQDQFDDEISMGDDSFCCSSMDESDDESLSLQSFNEDMFLDTPCIEEKKAPPSAASVLRQTISGLKGDLTMTLELCVPIRDESDFAHLLQAIRSNTTVTECSVSSECFESLPGAHRRELANAIVQLPALKSLMLDNVFPEFLYSINLVRCWKRDYYFQQSGRYCGYENKTIEDLQITNIPSDIAENLLGNLVMTAVSNFAMLEHLSLTFTSEFTGPQEILTRVALASLSHSSRLKDVKLGHEDDFGDYHSLLEVDTTRNETIMRVLKLRCSGDNLSDHSYMELSQVLKTNSRSLQGLVLDTTVDNAYALASVLGENNNLKALCLGTFDCQEKAGRDGLLSLVSQVLCCSKNHQRSLEYLSLVCQEMDDHGVGLLAKAFAQSSLRELMLFLDNETEDTVSTRGIEALAKVFEVNETIEEFSLICNSLDDEGLMAFAKALQANDGTLRKLKLQCSKGLHVTPKGYQAVLDMLQTNSTLELFELNRCPGSEEDGDDYIVCESLEAAHLEYQPQIDYFLNLNKSGVRDCQLNIDATPSEFRTLLMSQRHDLNTLYYMLSTNPSFVSFGT